ncbi:tetratricopeptide repeat protein [Pontibacter russatus]|uniref:tetratricopeptide repeat protein n=1 Tax=Pontibacter russatus TaxID=2694929 RepID=UPI001379FCE1|nr:tetratricopeptide repeat protein [Pontibacter russatus]
MKPVFLLLFLVSIFNGGLNVLSRINEYADRAAAAYQQEDYAGAIAAYKYLVYDLEAHDDQLQLNLAHAYYRAGLWSEAQQEYRLLVSHPYPHLRSVAHLQLGNIATKQKKYRQALALYRAALVAQPGSDAARYNYELLKKYIDLHPETPEDNHEAKQDKQENAQEPDSLASPPPATDELEPQPKKKPDADGDTEEETEQPAPDADGQQQQNAGAEGRGKGLNSLDGALEREQQSGSATGDTEGLNPEGQSGSALPQGGSAEGISDSDERAQMRRARLQQMNMSPEKARLLLDAMRNAELQYIQQLPKKSTRTPDHSKPDW